MSIIPIVIPPYEDELLYSWINRLARVNGLALNIFSKAFLNQTGVYIGELPYEIRNEYVNLYNSFYFKKDISKNYLEHSTLPFESLFMTTGDKIRLLRRITFPTDAINVPVTRLFSDINICPKCMEEDIENIGNPYLRTYHHLRGVKTCCKHNIPLMRYKGKRGHECDYIIKDYKEHEIQSNIDIHNEYSKFAYTLLKHGLNEQLDTIKWYTKLYLNYQGYGIHDSEYKKFKTDFMNSKYADLLQKKFDTIITNYLIRKRSINPEDFIPILMFAFKDAEVFNEIIKDSIPLLEDDNCPICGAKYMKINYSNAQHICPDCYYRLPIEKKYQDIVDDIGNGEYKVLDPLTSMNSRVRMQHKPCGNVYAYVPRYFVYQHSRCPECTKEHNDEWNRWFELLIQYKNEYGHVNVPKRYVDADGNSLGSWITSTRKAYNNGKLSENKIEMLKELGLDFSPFMSAWDKKFADYKAYIQETGQYHVSQGTSLGTWYNNQRNNYSKGKLSKDKLDRLRELYPDFPAIPIIEKKEIIEIKKTRLKFEEIIKLMLEYKSEHGDLLIPKRYSLNGYNLGAYVQQVRDKYKRGVLSKDYIDKLNEIGFIWNAEEYIWNIHIERYRRYVNETGNTVVVRNAIFEDYPLGTWYANTKAAKVKGFITEKQLQDMININSDF